MSRKGAKCLRSKNVYRQPRLRFEIHAFKSVSVLWRYWSFYSQTRLFCWCLGAQRTCLMFAPLSCEGARIRDISCFRCSKRRRRILKVVLICGLAKNAIASSTNQHRWAWGFSKCCARAACTTISRLVWRSGGHATIWSQRSNTQTVTTTLCEQALILNVLHR